MSERLEGVRDFDFALLKDTTITEGKNQFRWEVYSAFNHTNLSGFANVVNIAFVLSL